MGSEKGPFNASGELPSPSQRRHGLGLVPGIKTRILVSGTTVPTPLRRAPRTVKKKKARGGVNACRPAIAHTPKAKRVAKNKPTFPTIGTALTKRPPCRAESSSKRKGGVKRSSTPHTLTTPAEPPFDSTLDSLRNLCKIVGSVRHGTHISAKPKPPLSQAPIIADHPAPVLQAYKAKALHAAHVDGAQVQSPVNTHSEDTHSHEILCKVIHPRQIDLDAFLSSDGCDAHSENVEVIGSISTAEEANPTSSVPEVWCPASNDAQPFDSLRQLAASYCQRAAASTCDKNNGTVTVSNADASKCITNEVHMEKDCEKAILKPGVRAQEQRSLGFNSLRQLVNSYLKSEPKQKELDISKMSRKKQTCDECGHKSKTFYDLVKHIKYKHGPSVYVCPVSGCNFTTKYPNNIKHHQTKHTQVRPHQCGECKRRFKRKNQLATHILTHSDERPFACEQCDFRTKRGWVLAQHVTSKHSTERRFECEECGFRMKTRSDMNKHRATHTRTKDLTCPDCDRTFTHRTRLLVHQKNMHSKRPLIPCSEKNCKQKFRLKTALQKHVNVVHKGIRNFICNVCRRTFSTKSNLENHMVTHDPTNRPFKCPICPYSGKEDAHVRAHIGSMHDVQMPGFSCDMCNVSFRVGVKLRQHLTTQKHQQNARLHLPPQDREVKPYVGSAPIVETSPVQSCSEPKENAEAVKEEEDLQCVVVKQEGDTANSGNEKNAAWYKQ